MTSMKTMKIMSIFLFVLFAICSFADDFPFRTDFLHFGTSQELAESLAEIRSEWASATIDISVCTNAMNQLIGCCEQADQKTDLAWQNAKRSLYLYASMSNELETCSVLSRIYTNGVRRTIGNESRTRSLEEVAAARSHNHYTRLYLLYRLLTLGESGRADVGDFLLGYVLQEWVGPGFGTETGIHERRHVIEDNLDIPSLLLWISSNPSFSKAVHNRAKTIRKRWLVTYPDWTPSDEEVHPERNPDATFEANMLSGENEMTPNVTNISLRPIQKRKRFEFPPLKPSQTP